MRQPLKNYIFLSLPLKKTYMLNPILIEVPTIFESMTVNCWLIKEPKPILIDCGELTDQAWDALEEGLANEGLKIKDLTKIFITHAHLDHMGMANKITQHSDAEIWVSEWVYPWAVDLKKSLDQRDAALVSAYKEYGMERVPQFGYKQLSPYWEKIPEDRLKIFPMNGTVSMGGREIEVIHAPGHCINQTCFFQRETGELFSGDMLLEIIAPPILDMNPLPPHERTQSLSMMLESFQKFRELPIKVAYPGHMGIIEHAKETIDSQVKRIHRKKEKTFELIQSGINHFSQLWPALYKKRLTPPSFLMTLGFLDLLRDEGRILINPENGNLHAIEADILSS